MGRINVNHRHTVTPRRTALAAAAACGAAVLALLGGSSIAAADDQCSNADIRAAQGSTHLTDCRAYEWISWQNPGGQVAGVDVALRVSQSWARADGNKLLYFATSQIGPEAERGIVQLHHFGERTEHGWTSRPGISINSPDAMTDTLSSSQGTLIPSGDLSAFGFLISRSLGPPNPILNGGTLYTSSGIGTERWVSEPEPGLPAVASSGAIIGGTPDFSSVYMTSSARLTTQPNGGLLEYRDGVLRPAGLLPDGTAATGLLPAGGTAAVGFSATEPVKRRNQVSADGRRVFFTAVVGGVRQLYVREDNARTRLLSHALGAPTTPSTAGVDVFNGITGGYAFATPDGSRVIFRSSDVLAAGAESAPAADVKTYRADVATAALTYLPDVGGPPVALDADASRIMWLRPDAGSDRSLMVWDEENRRTFTVDGARPASTTEFAWAGTTADGTAWTVQSTNALDPAFPETSGRSQVFRWELGDRSPTCLSCVAGATYPSNANLTSFSLSTTDTAAGGSGSPAMRSQIGPRSMSADGRRVFFDTSSALVPEDVNGVRDVYMWEKGHGVSLISDGRNPKPSWFADAGASGDDVFIVTAAGLAPGDRDGSYDLYDARVGGGFETVPDAGCDGDACQPPVAPRTPTSSSGSDQVGTEANGPDDIAPSPARITVKRVTRDRTGATLRIGTSSAGAVQLTGQQVVTVRRTLSKKGALTVRVSLNRTARRTLARRGRVTASIRVRFAPRSGRAVTTTVTTTIKGKR